MGIGASAALIALGAILTFAVEVQSTDGININTIGIILMVVGAIGLLMTSLVFGPRTSGRGRRDPPRRLLSRKESPMGIGIGTLLLIIIIVLLLT